MKQFGEKVLKILLPTPKSKAELLIYEKLIPYAAEKRDKIVTLVEIPVIEAELRSLIWVSNNCYISDGFNILSQRIKELQQKLRELKTLHYDRQNTEPDQCDSSL